MKRFGLLLLIALAGCDASDPAPVHQELVEASGRVQHSRLCAPAPGDCAYGIDLVGSVPDGEATVRGVLRDGKLQVVSVGPATPEAEPVADERVPCPAPDGGWTRGRAEDDGLNALIYDEHPEWFRDIRVGYPQGPPDPVVFVVEIVAADHAAVERMVRGRYAGDVCIVVTEGAKSLADQQAVLERVQAVVDPLTQDPANGIYQVTGGDKVQLDVVAATPDLRERLAPVLDLVELNPWLRPVR